MNPAHKGAPLTILGLARMAAGENEVLIMTAPITEPRTRISVKFLSDGQFDAILQNIRAKPHAYNADNTYESEYFVAEALKADVNREKFAEALSYDDSIDDVILREVFNRPILNSTQRLIGGLFNPMHLDAMPNWVRMTDDQRKEEVKAYNDALRESRRYVSDVKKHMAKLGMSTQSEGLT